jgi:hypothetical protein
VGQQLIRGDLSDLAAVVATDHAAIRQTFVEVHRRPDTPGVVQQLSQYLYAAIEAHGRAEEDVVHPAVRAVLGPSTAAELALEHARIDHLVRMLLPARDAVPDGSAFEELERAVERHMEHEEADVLPRLEAAAGPKTIASLALAYAQARERYAGTEPG